MGVVSAFPCHDNDLRLRKLSCSESFPKHITEGRFYYELKNFQAGFLANGHAGGIRFSLVGVVCGLGACSQVSRVASGHYRPLFREAAGKSADKRASSCCKGGIVICSPLGGAVQLSQKTGSIFFFEGVFFSIGVRFFSVAFCKSFLERITAEVLGCSFRLGRSCHHSDILRIFL